MIYDGLNTLRYMTNSVAVFGQLDKGRSSGTRDERVLYGLEMEKLVRESKARKLNSLTYQDSMHEDGEANGYFVDDGTGIKLSEKMVHEGRTLEMKTFKEMGVYEYVLKSDAQRSKSGKLVGVRWVDVQKGSIVRSRLVAQEFAGKDVRDDLFAATPPLSATKYVISEVASKSDSGTNDWRLMVLDVKRAFLYGNINEEIYIHLPREDQCTVRDTWQNL